MKLTANEEYGVRCLVRLGYAGYSGQALRVLRRGGFVKAARGKEGGYTLAGPPKPS